MNKQEAINLVSQVCAAFKGSLQEHQLLQQAIVYLNTLEEKAKEQETKPVEKTPNK